VAVSVDTKSLAQVLRSETGMNTLLTLEFSGTSETCKALVRDVQTEPVRDGLLHADFLRISLTEMIEVSVQLEFVGAAVGVKTQGGVLHVRRHELDVKCLPTDIPERIEVDVTELSIGDEIRSTDITLPSGVELTSDEARMLVHVVPPTRVVTPEEEAAAAEEAAEAEEGEAAPEGGPEGEGEEGSEG